MDNTCRRVHLKFLLRIRKHVAYSFLSVWQFLRKLGMTVQEDSVIPHLGIYPEDSPACNKVTSSTMFIAALFIIARR